MDFPKDPLTNIVFPGIKEPIRLLIENNYYFAALAMIYSGIDAIAYLGIPASKDEVKSPDFIAWCDQYLDLSCPSQPNGVEWWGARCGILHTHSGTSRRSKSREARLIHYVDRCDPPIMCNPDNDGGLVIVSIHHLASAFFNGVDRYLVQLFANAEKAKVAERRLRNMLVVGGLNHDEQTA